ncbi:MAG: hypothetical protein Q8Q47_02555, partial [Ignavibacteriaceae bacterium]|nr:hypothetical protein [Ignavibacteriaceae bacterium]
MEDYIRNTFPNNELIIPQLVDNIPINTSLVYILTYKNVPIIVGEGKKKRARVIFHNKDYYPEAHMKSITARLHIIYGNPEFLRRYIIVCNSREEAKVIQNKIHRERGGQGPC